MITAHYACWESTAKEEAREVRAQGRRAFFETAETGADRHRRQVPSQRLAGQQAALTASKQDMSKKIQMLLTETQRLANGLSPHLAMLPAPPFRGATARRFGPTFRGMTKGRTGARLGDLVEAAKGLAHPARLRLLGMLEGGELCVCQMTAVLGLAPSTVSQHLSVLAHGGLVAERKTGKLVFYRLRQDGPAGALLPPLLDLLAADPEARADRKVVAGLRRLPASAVCAAEIDVAAAGVRRSIEKPPLPPF